ncbi:MAG TPA: protein kinase [Gemmataceae bacterium]|jgi:serine/threonine protein kinase
MNYNLLRTIRSSDDWLVWRGEHPASGERCLIKQPQPSADAARLTDQLAREYGFLQPLQHDNLIRPRHWDPAAPCLLLEDARGSVAQLLAREGTLAPELVVNLLVQCLDALAYLHERQLGHGCISTHTILVDPRGAVKFGDFTGYRFEELAPPPPDHPMKYQAPELLDSTVGECGPSSDLYCLGHTALELLLGEEYPLLFAGPGCSAADVQANWLGWHAHPGRELTNLSQSLPLVPPALLDVLGRMIRKQPRQRGYRSAADARQAVLATGLNSRRPLPDLEDAAPKPLAASKPTPALDQAPNARSGRTLCLTWKQGGKSKTRKFHPDRTVIVGNAAPCELPLAFKGISRRHALLLSQTNGQWWVYDLHSSLGTWHNGTSIRAARLQRGDELRFGPLRCRVSFEAKKRGGDRLGPFRQLTPIHEGRNGMLYRASWPGNTSHPIVALRVFPPDFQFDSEQIRRFLRGIPQAAAFRHPNLLRLYRGGSVRDEEKRTWYIAMEYAAGGSLRDRILRDRGLTGAQTFAFAYQALQGLRAIAEQRLLHRNLTPSCILFDDQDRVKIGDFVMMRGDHVESFQQITHAGSPPREHIYQAPEQVRGVPDLTPSSDLYSLAAIMYETLTGQPPFRTDLKLPEMIEAICHQPIAPPRSLNPALPREIDAFLLRALDKQPERRFQSADEFEQGLRAIKGDLPGG